MRSFSVVVLCVLAHANSAFVLPQQHHLKNTKTKPLFSNRSSSDSTLLDGKLWKKVKPPEDYMFLGGDVIALFTYSMMDHIAHDAFFDLIQSSGVSEALEQYPSMKDSTNIGMTPFWLDTFLYDKDEVISKLAMQHYAYTPLLQNPIVGFGVLCGCWVLCGIVISKAFSYRNTINCSMTKMLAVTGRTWISSTFLVISLIFAQQYLDVIWSGDGSEFTVGLSKPDLRYIFDTLCVLSTWRFCIGLALRHLPPYMI